MSGAPDIGALYLRHGDAMYRVAASVLREVGRASEAADAVQDAILSIIASPPDNVGNWEAFLVTAAKRKALDRVKSAEVRRTGGEFDSRIHDREDEGDLAEEVAADVDRQRLAAVAWDCLSILDDRHRRVVWEMAALERKRSELADEMGVSPPRISQMLTHGLHLLREEMERRDAD